MATTIPAAELSDRIQGLLAERARLVDAIADIDGTLAGVGTVLGGSAPKAMLELLAREPLRSQVDWDAVEIYFGDERCVPPDHPERNFATHPFAKLLRCVLPSGR